MKRTKSEEKEEPVFHNVESTNGYKDSLELKTKNPFYCHSLGHGSKIEILWPTGRKTIHTITMKDITRQTFTSTVSLSFPCIDIIHNGIEIKNVRLYNLEGIKARIIDPVILGDRDDDIVYCYP